MLEQIYLALPCQISPYAHIATCRLGSAADNDDEAPPVDPLRYMSEGIPYLPCASAGSRLFRLWQGSGSLQLR